MADAIDVVERIEQMVRTTSELDKQTDVEIAGLLVDHVWAHMDMLSPQSYLMMNAIDRLRRSVKKEIVRAPCPTCKGNFDTASAECATCKGAGEIIAAGEGQKTIVDDGEHEPHREPKK